MKSRYKQFYQFLSCGPYAAVLKDPNFTKDMTKFEALAKQISTVIVPHKDITHPRIAFKIRCNDRHKRIGFVTTIRYLQVNETGSLEVLNSNFQRTGEHPNNYLFPPEALNMKDKLLFTKLFVDQKLFCSHCITLNHITDTNSRFSEILLFIARDGSVSYSATPKDGGVPKINMLNQTTLNAFLKGTVALEACIIGDLDYQFTLGLN